MRGPARGTIDLSGEDRILALAATAFGWPVDPLFLAKLRHAADLWAQGEKSLAHIHLAQCRLPKLETDEQAFRLFLADALIDAGVSPRALCRAMGFDLPQGLKKYDPDEARDDHGRWTSGGGSGGRASISYADDDAGAADQAGAQTAPASSGDATDSAGPDAAHITYEFSGDKASQTIANPDGTSIVTSWTQNRGSGLTQTDQICLANGEVAATCVTDSKATQTVSLSEAGAKEGLVIEQPPGGVPILIPAVAARTTVVLDEPGETTNIGRWFLTGAGVAASAVAGVFYFGSTTAAGPQDATTPIGAGDEFRILSNPDTAIGVVQHKIGDDWANTGLTVVDHEIISDGSAAAAQHLRDLQAAVAAIPNIGPQPLRADTPVPPIFANVDHAGLRELNFDSYVAAGATGEQADGSFAVLALGLRGATWAAGDERPVIGRLSQEQVEAACPAYPKVQAVTSASYANVTAQNPNASPQNIGNMVHDEVAAAFFGQPGFAIKAGFLNGTRLETGLRVAGSSFLDVLHDVGNGTICIFDVKTGMKGFESRQINQYWNEAKQAFQDAQQIIVTEVRPRWRRQGF